jgi:hypothetical protein
MGHRSSSSTSSVESAAPFSPVEEADGVLLFSTLSRKDRCARRAALYALSVGRALGSMPLLGDKSSTIHFSNANEVKSLRNEKLRESDETKDHDLCQRKRLA